jgi:hypothetical protein
MLMNRRRTWLLTTATIATAASTLLWNRQRLYSIDDDDDETRIKKVIGVFRHGARTPIGEIPSEHVRNLVWDNCIPHNALIPGRHQQPLYFESAPVPNEQQILGNCIRGQLTREGMKQMETVGMMFAVKYAPWLHQIMQGDPHSYKNNLNRYVFVRTTDVSTRRTELSAQHFLAGFSETLLGHDLDDYVLPIIYRHEYTAENMYPNTKLCPIIGELLKHMKSKDPIIQAVDNSPEVHALKQDLSRIFTSDQIGHVSHSGEATDKGLPTFEGIHNGFDMIKFHKKLLPPGITDEHLEKIETVVASTIYRMYSLEHEEGKKLTSLTIGLFLNEILSGMKDTMSHQPDISDNSIRYKPVELYFGHDTTIIPLLGALGISSQLNQWPGVGSGLVFELHGSKNGEHYVRTLFNGKPMVLQGSNGYLCPFSVFEQLCKNIYPEDFYNQCKIPLKSTH